MTIKDFYPLLCVSNTEAAMEFYADAFGALWDENYESGDTFALVDFGDSTIMLEQEDLEIDATPVSFCLSVGDVDAVVKRAVDLGATIVEEVHDSDSHPQRLGTILDPFGYRWEITQFFEEVEAEEIQRL